MIEQTGKEEIEITKEQVIPPKEPKGLAIWLTIPLFFLTMIIILGLVSDILDLIYSLLAEETYKETTLFKVVEQWVMFFSVWLSAWLVMKYMDQQPTQEIGMSIHGRGKDILYGLLMAIVLYVIGFGVLLATGNIVIEGINPSLSTLATSFVFFLPAAMIEEVMTRGYILNRLMSKMNKFLALVLSSVLFSVMHAGNPNLGTLPYINLFLAGVMLGASYIYTRNLWFPISLHVFWNWIQGPVLGFEVSGTNMFSPLLTISRPEENILNGGLFGFEGSILCSIISLAAATFITLWCIKQKKQETIRTAEHQSS
ncbi:CPBP family intramembrane metalloprotease [Bacteroides sp. 214]|uniref:CPBP family intramembrane glutamic endopeptidase n=1 Tax=Bacteroides sp. 214 TaxID=2302935 RepID=UPI0013CF9830|nr:type II CAAX endopeptidase family protein [Bacteroides sp. 214]NDW11572.1 CPBP family intramembrane metalloprotease [Bacteroides sp. 214]